MSQQGNPFPDYLHPVCGQKALMRVMHSDLNPVSGRRLSYQTRDGCGRKDIRVLDLEIRLGEMAVEATPTRR